MKRRSIVRAYENIRPDAQARERMLENILHSSEIPSAGKDETVKPRKIVRYLIAAVIVAMLVGTVGMATELLKVPVKETATFVSNDGTIEFNFDIDDEVLGEVIPSVEVTPHFFTGEEAKQVATVLFGDAEFYEEEPFETIQFSKGEIQQKLDRWQRYASEEALYKLFDNKLDEPAYIEDALEVVNKFINEYTTRYEDAPDEIVHEPCRWQLRNSIEYMFPEDEWGEHIPNENNDEVSVRVIADGVQYSFSASQRNNETFRVNNISASMGGDISPYNIDELIRKAELCRTSEPTQEQIDAAKLKAENWLSQMNLGNWMVDECYVESNGEGEYKEYTICVNAVPVFNGIPVIRREQLHALRGEEAGVSYYYHPDVIFRFAPNGELLLFHMYSPVDIVSSSYESEMLSIDELMEIAKENLISSSASGFSYIPTAYEGYCEVGCRITVRDVDYSLTRMTDVDTREPFVYALGVSLSGSVEYYNKDTGETLEFVEDRIILVLDGKDGTFVGRR